MSDTVHSMFKDRPGITPKRWTCFKLAHVDGLSSIDIGKRLHMIPAAVDEAVCRFRKSLPQWPEFFPPRPRGTRG